MKWLPVKNYEELYEVSETGLVRSVDRWVITKNQRKRLHKGKEISQLPNKSVQYMQVSLWKNNYRKNHYIHRLVAEVFIPNPFNLLEVNHIDGNRQNNHVSNLEWVSRSGNSAHAIKTGLRIYTNRLTEDEFLECLHSVINGESYVELSKRIPYNVPFISTKLRALAKKYSLEEDLNQALSIQQKVRKENTGKKQRLLRGKPIQMLDPNTDTAVKTFNSIGEALECVSTFTSTSSGSISNAALGRQKTAGGYKWKYI